MKEMKNGLVSDHHNLVQEPRGRTWIPVALSQNLDWNREKKETVKPLVSFCIPQVRPLHANTEPFLGPQCRITTIAAARALVTNCPPISLVQHAQPISLGKPEACRNAGRHREIRDHEWEEVSVGKQAIDVEFGLSSDVYFAVGHSWNCEFDGIAGLIAVSRRLRAVPQLIVDIERIISMEDRRTTSWRLSRAVQAVVDRPNHPVRRAGGRHGWRRPRVVEAVARLQHRCGVEEPRDGVEREGFQRAARSGDKQRVLPECTR